MLTRARLTPGGSPGPTQKSLTRAG